ncbi:hypothetical protein H4R34_004226 [Dimargaris verticillata]|uniref:BD-FAE-like domain-containing protein n=1 Tax=Dimargaris verticillata TaxID=2761393 RepID=A0A9W8B310_9FUNG|nr:hypothetical protein H4R34_004226 [Dimargaris verticillata]
MPPTRSPWTWVCHSAAHIVLYTRHAIQSNLKSSTACVVGASRACRITSYRGGAGLLKGPVLHSLFQLPWNPIRVLKLGYAALENLSDLFSGPVPIVVRWIIEKLFSRRTPPGAVVRNLRYGANADCQQLDLFIPDVQTKAALGHTPIICFIYGKTWASAQRRVYVPMAHTLRKQGYLVVLPELRRPPMGTVAHMIDDTLQCLLWIQRNAAAYGGDAASTFLMGHGAGAHISAMAASVWTIANTKIAPTFRLHALQNSQPSSPRSSRPGLKTRPNARVPPTSGGNTPLQASAYHSPLVRPPYSPVPGTNTSLPSAAHMQTSLEFYQQLQHYTLLARQAETTAGTPPLAIAGLILFAGVYDIADQHDYECQRGIDAISATTRLVVDQCSSSLFSSTVLLRALCTQAHTTLCQTLFPKKILLIHGEKDTVIPLQSSEQFFNLLCQLDVEDADLKVYSRTKSLNPAIALLTESASLCQSILSDIRATILDGTGEPES